MICIGRLKWKRKHRNQLFSSEEFNFSSDVMWAYSCLLETVSQLPETRLDAETGARCSSHLDNEGQDVVLNILEVFVNRWRRVLANVTSRCPERGERKIMGGKPFSISNGTKDIKIQRKRVIRGKSIKIVSYYLQCNEIYYIQ